LVGIKTNFVTDQYTSHFPINAIPVGLLCRSTPRLPDCTLQFLDQYATVHPEMTSVRPG